MIPLRPVLNILGYLYVGLALVMLVPAIVDVAARNPDWQAFVMSSLIVGMIGVLLVAALGGSLNDRLDVRQVFLLTTLAWVTIPAFGALPFLGLGIGYVDAAFETISGFTTTGSTVLTGLDTLPPGLLLWRSLSHWFGGVGIIVMAIVLMPLLRIGGMQLFRAESSDRSEKVVSRASDLVRWIGGVYVALTLLCAVLYRISGMSAFDAINHAMSTLSSGGFSTHDESFAYFDNNSTLLVCIIFMLASGLPFVMMIKSLRQGSWALFEDPQVRVFLGTVFLSSAGICLYLGIDKHVAFTEAFISSLFVVTSIITTTGFGLGDYIAWGPPMVGLILTFTFFGACTGSTSGGIKMLRFIVFFGTVRAYMKKLIRPDRVVVVRYGDTKITPDLSFSVLAFLVVYMATVGVITVILTAMGLDLVTSFSSAATAVSNVGPGLGEVVGPVGNFASLPDNAKIVLSVAMLLGRLELFTVLVLFDPEFWR
ncbi:TrkH family potassium uptake protein [Pseudovibrio sp. SPO723]|uniref:TrkH family potassium uptake protein n=1 Tax=Nesiotobacter zosterae TaxID=392721 RepID=UPI0029C220B8|nr:TrkH family potassium uptake protein [Pseudovibrio sp. SPO723]MDX5594632.1 TrkH family potassium uptake protein [Pseudovibrio sp. SPO723]